MAWIKVFCIFSTGKAQARFCSAQHSRLGTGQLLLSIISLLGFYDLLLPVPHCNLGYSGTVFMIYYVYTVCTWSKQKDLSTAVIITTRNVVELRILNPQVNSILCKKNYCRLYLGFRSRKDDVLPSPKCNQKMRKAVKSDKISGISFLLYLRFALIVNTLTISNRNLCFLK